MATRNGLLGVHIEARLDLGEQSHLRGGEAETKVAASIETGFQARPVLDLREYQVDELVRKFDGLVAEDGNLATGVVAILGLPLGNTVLDPRHPGAATADGLNNGSGDIEKVGVLDSLGDEAVHVHGVDLGNVVEVDVLLKDGKSRSTSGSTQGTVLEVGRITNPLS